MKQHFKLIITSLLLILGVSFSFVSIGAAAPVDLFPGNTCNGNTTVCPDSSGKGVFTVIGTIIDVLLYLAGIIAVIVIIIGGIRYVTSNGDQSRIKAAKDTVMYAVVGLAVTILSFAIVNFVIDKL